MVFSLNKVEEDDKVKVIFNVNMIPQSLDAIDNKMEIKFLEDYSKNGNISGYSLLEKDGKSPQIWLIDNFLSETECDNIISKGEEVKFSSIEKSYDKKYRDSTRILAFDKNLEELFKRRLNQDHLIDRINEKKVLPLGFNNINDIWEPLSGDVNPCFRLNKYTNSIGFDWHRDAPFCDGRLNRSIYTIIVYLNDNFQGGKTIFLKPINGHLSTGKTIEEELKILNGNYTTIEITPQKGKAIIFDQRLIHKGEKIDGTKYIFRTDIICKPLEIFPLDSFQQSLKDLTCCLFRQAQYYELKNQSNDKYKEDASKLYEICISLRQNPDKITEYPEHLKNLLIDIINPIPISSTLNYISRNGNECKFTYDGDENLLGLIKFASMFSILVSTMDISDLLEKQLSCKVKEHLIILIKNSDMNVSFDYIFQNSGRNFNKEIIYLVSDENSSRLVIKNEYKESIKSLFEKYKEDLIWVKDEERRWESLKNIKYRRVIDPINEIMELDFSDDIINKEIEENKEDIELWNNSYNLDENFFLSKNLIKTNKKIDEEEEESENSEVCEHDEESHIYLGKIYKKFNKIKEEKKDEESENSEVCEHDEESHIYLGKIYKKFNKIKEKEFKLKKMNHTELSKFDKYKKNKPIKKCIQIVSSIKKSTYAIMDICVKHGHYESCEPLFTQKILYKNLDQELKINPFIIGYKIDDYSSTITGSITIITKGVSINHASCETDSIYKNISNLDVYKTLEFDNKFNINRINKTIVINCIPKISM